MQTIRNDRHRQVSAQRIRELRDIAEDLPPLERSATLDVVAELEEAVAEFDSIRAGRMRTFRVESFDDLATVLVKARIALGWTQAELANRLDVAEQMVQRDEAGGYERATLSRLAEVGDVLGYELTGVFSPAAHRQREPVDLLDAWSSSFQFNTGFEEGRRAEPSSTSLQTMPLAS